MTPEQNGSNYNANCLKKCKIIICSLAVLCLGLISSTVYFAEKATTDINDKNNTSNSQPAKTSEEQAYLDLFPYLLATKVNDCLINDNYATLCEITSYDIEDDGNISASFDYVFFDKETSEQVGEIKKAHVYFWRDDKHKLTNNNLEITNYSQAYSYDE